MAQAAENGAPGETEAIKRTANRERLTALGGQGRVEAPPALAQQAAQAGGAIRQAEAVSPAPMERALALRSQPRRLRKGKDASYGCSAQTTNHNRAWSGSASLTALRRK
jgi:hypothetical protein